MTDGKVGITEEAQHLEDPVPNEPGSQPPPTWRRVSLLVGAGLLGAAVVGVFGLLGSGLIPGASPGPTASGSEPSLQSAVLGASSAPSPVDSAASSPSSPTPRPIETPLPISSAFSILPGVPPGELPDITCTGSIGASDPVALVRLRTTDPTVSPPLVLRDYADQGSPRTACTFSQTRVVQLIDARHAVIGFSRPGLMAVVDLPDVRFHWFQLPYTAEVSSELLAVSPQLAQIVWLKAIPDNETSFYRSREIHVTTAAGDAIMATLPDEPTGFCGFPADWSKHAAYSSSGELFYVLDQPRTLAPMDGGVGSTTAQYSLRVFAGTTMVHAVVPPPGGWPAGDHPAYPVWSPTSEALYYRQGDDLWRWTPSGGLSQFLAGVPWTDPTISADGRYLAYALPRADGASDVYLAEFADLPVAGGSAVIGEAVVGPVFLNNAQLWYARPAESHGCVGFDDELDVVIYNADTHDMARSIIDGVEFVWPAVSSTY